MTKALKPEDYDRAFASLKNLVDQAEAAYLSGNLSLTRHATANLAFATQLIHTSLKRSERIKA